MLLHYCFWSHITFPSASLGVLERKLKELQQTVILHLLPGCSTPASLSPKGCMGRLGSQTQRRKPIHKILHTLISSLLPQQTSSPQQRSPSVAVCHSLDRTKQFLRNAVSKIVFQGESRSVLCAVRSCDVCPQKHPVGLMTRRVRDCMETVLVRTESMEWLKVFGRNSLHLF